METLKLPLSMILTWNSMSIREIFGINITLVALKIEVSLGEILPIFNVIFSM